MVLIIDPQNAGIAGNMIAGAFVDLGCDPNEIKQAMETVAKDCNYQTSPLIILSADVLSIGYALEVQRSPKLSSARNRNIMTADPVFSSQQTNCIII